jgi:thymidylate synthase (FAD)
MSDVCVAPGGAKYVTEPRVSIVAQTYFDPIEGLRDLAELFGSVTAGISDYEEGWSEPEALTQFAGQLCYLSLGNDKRTPLVDNKSYIERIFKAGHGSVLEHSSYSVLMLGIDRACTHELVRHRAGTAFSQVSQRYVDDTRLRFVLPWEYKQSNRLTALFETDIDKALESYRIKSNALREVMPKREDESNTDYRKRIQSCSRETLPNCTEAPIIVTANTRSWRHIISMRTSSHADVRIRVPMIAVLKELQTASPNHFGDFTVGQLPDGSESAETPYPKV